jgi:hypothetical protein
MGINMRQEHRPSGPKPTTLEANVLKLRALEMVLMLFYIEDLRRFILGSIDATERSRQLRVSQPAKAAVKPGKKMDLARELLVSKGVLTQAESDELFELIEFRNLIGHQVQDLVVAVGANAHLAATTARGLRSGDRYDNKAVQRVKDLRRKVFDGMRKGFILVVGFDALKFEAAETTYLREIKRLHAKVDKGLLDLKVNIARANESIKAIPTSVLEAIAPGHPAHRKANGNLTEGGLACLRRLFDEGATPLAAAHLMELSLAAVERRFKKWQESA